MSQIFSKNAAGLLRHPQLLKLANEGGDVFGDEKIRIEPAKNGSPTLVAHETPEKTFTYHSRYNPEHEAKKIADSIFKNQSHVILLGFGLGYVLSEIFPRLPKPEQPFQIIVIEPDPIVFKAALHTRDLQKYLQDFRVAWCVGISPDEFGEIWFKNLDWGTLEDLLIIEHPPSIERFAAYFERIREKIKFFSNRSKGNLQTMMHAGTQFMTNNFLNFGAFSRLPGIGRLFNKFQNIPAILVSAGPSLDRNVHLLQEVKGKFLIIAVDTAFRQLVARGIRPDIVCAGDPSYLNSLDFIGVEKETEVVLAAELMTHPDIFESFQGPKMLMTFGWGLAVQFEKFREPIGTVNCWGSVSTTTFDLARKLGCDPIIFIGLDLSFQDGLLYARGSYYDDIFYHSIHPFTSLEHENVEYILRRGTHKYATSSGLPLYTDANMNIYKGWFEDQFRQTGQTIINATEGGIVSQFVTVQTLQEAIQQNSSKSGPINQIIAAALQEPIEVQKKSLEKAFGEIGKVLRQNLQTIKEGTNLCRKLSKKDVQRKVKGIPGEDRMLIEDAMKLHDVLCKHELIMSWFSNHHTKFFTKHRKEINHLTSNPDATIEAWITELQLFFDVTKEFHEYQIPLIDFSLRSIQDPAHNKPKKLGEFAQAGR